MKRIWTSSSGLIELEFSQDEYESVPNSGPADDAVAELAAKQNIVEEFAKYSDENISECLEEYGAWTTEELKDRRANIERLIWIACLDLREESEPEE